jgi:UDP-N-acetylglucosamine enolpyruvyl transferase
MQNTLITMMAAALLAAATGCGASFPTPTQKLADAESANRSARELGAEKKTAAQLNLKLSDEEIEAAKAQMKDGNNQRAEYILLRAKADAELALALSRETDAKIETVKAVDSSTAKQNATQNANGSK